jgi:hypothetical protein
LVDGQVELEKEAYCVRESCGSVHIVCDVGLGLRWYSSVLICTGIALSWVPTWC